MVRSLNLFESTTSASNYYFDYGESFFNTTSPNVRITSFYAVTTYEPNTGGIGTSPVVAIYTCNSESNNYTYQGTSPPAAGALSNDTWGWNYNGQSQSSSFTLPSSTYSYLLNWTAQQPSSATYNSNTQSSTTSGTFAGSLSVLSIYFTSPSTAPVHFIIL